MDGARKALSTLPGLATGQGLFGSLSQNAGPAYGESVVDIMVYIYDVIPPEWKV